ncbi:sensor histidine kinase [Porcipelethomonas sp.]|uniref:sensor histidine kinase n=1 Tax=Porcipelethomonas sp. TaxID=2981675 RepID=UPI003EF4CAD8
MNTPKTKTAVSLKFRIWEYFIFFTAVVFIMLWFFQIVFLENFYERMKISDVKQSAQEIISEYGSDNYGRLLTEIAISNDLCIEIVDKYGRVIYTKDTLGKSCLIHSPESMKSDFLAKLKESGEDTIYFKKFNSAINNDMLVFAAVIGSVNSPDGYLLINTPLVPVGSTVSIIKRQLFLITIYLVLLSLIISFFMARRISEPITKITKSAEKMAAGNYNIKFEGGDYLEIQQLASTLTYAGEQISKVDAMQRDLIANVSHDLRTPLTMLKAYAEMIRDLSGDNPQKRNEHLEIIIEETDRLAQLVNDILDLGKLEDGSQKLNYSEFNIKELMEDIITRYDGISKKKDYHIHFEADEDIIVKCDFIKIQQVIYNLINNAINYTGEDKQVFVRQKNMDGCVRIEVADTGDGIESDKIKLIFDKYYRSENHKREVVGTGLGLSIVKAILKKHGYNFGVYSVVGKGSTFWFEIKDIVTQNGDEKLPEENKSEKKHHEKKQHEKKETKEK